MWRCWRDRQYLPHWRHRRHHIRVLLTIGTFTVELMPERTILMAETINAGQTLAMSIEYTDTDGNKTKTWPTDSAPSWGESNETAVDLVQTVDGNSATALGLDAGGDDTITATVMVGGVSFKGSLALTVNPKVVVPPPPPAPVLAGIAIIPGDVTGP